jgi:hypothetical protein
MDASRIDGTFQEGYVRWRIGRIVPAFVESNMSCMLDFAGEIIKVISMLEGALKTKKDAWSSMNINLRVAFISGQGINTTAKDAKMRQIWTFPSTHSNGGVGSITTGDTIGNVDEVDECIWPILRWKGTGI